MEKGRLANQPGGVARCKTCGKTGLLKAACRLKSDQEVEEASRLGVEFKDEPNIAFSLTDDTLFRYLIDSFQDKWKPDLAVIGSMDKLLRDHPIYVDEKPATSAGR